MGTHKETLWLQTCSLWVSGTKEIKATGNWVGLTNTSQLQAIWINKKLKKIIDVNNRWGSVWCWLWLDNPSQKNFKPQWFSKCIACRFTTK